MNPKISSFIAEKIQGIGLKYSLHIDQTGKLSEYVLAVVSGKLPADEFVDSVEKGLGIAVELAIDISTDVNIEIFLPVREMLSAPTTTDPNNKDSLLSAIENPTPTEHPISIAQPKPVEKTRPSSGTDVAHEFIGEKLTTPVSLPSQKTVVTNVESKPTPTVDPYREPLS